MARGATNDSLVAKLGPPLYIEPISEPERILYTAAEYGYPTFLVDYRSKKSQTSDNQTVVPQDVATTIRYYRFTGRLKREANYGDLLGAELMSFGLVELEVVPKAIGERWRAQDHLLVVWFNENDVALAYKWEAMSALPRGAASAVQDPQ